MYIDGISYAGHGKAGKRQQRRTRWMSHVSCAVDWRVAMHAILMRTHMAPHDVRRSVMVHEANALPMEGSLESHLVMVP